MRFKSVFVLVLLCGLWPAKASADNRFIVRTTLDLETLQTVCNLPLLPCTVVRGLGDPGDELFLITSPLDLDELLALTKTELPAPPISFSTEVSAMSLPLPITTTFSAISDISLSRWLETSTPRPSLE